MAPSTNAPKYEGLTGTDFAGIPEHLYRVRYPFFLEEMQLRIYRAE